MTTLAPLLQAFLTDRLIAPQLASGRSAHADYLGSSRPGTTAGHRTLDVCCGAARRHMATLVREANGVKRVLVFRIGHLPAFVRGARTGNGTHRVKA